MVALLLEYDVMLHATQEDAYTAIIRVSTGEMPCGNGLKDIAKGYYKKVPITLMPPSHFPLNIPENSS